MFSSEITMKHRLLISFLLIIAGLIAIIPVTNAQNANIGHVVDVLGRAWVNTVYEEAPKIGYELQVSDTLVTGYDGYIEFDFQNHSRVHLMANSRLMFHQTDHLNHAELRIKLLKGEMLIETGETPFPIQITTPTAIASASNARYNIRVHENNSTTFTGIHGSVEITAAASGDTQMLSRRNKLSTDMRGQYFILQQVSNREMDTILNTIQTLQRTPGLNSRN